MRHAIADGRRGAALISSCAWSTSSASGAGAASPEAVVEAAEERAALLRAVNSLDGKDRRVIACRFFLDLDVAETAAVLNCSEGTVKSRLSRALERLRGRMALPADGT
jgi:RNA polymerase sigma-70 factor (ECF subfamily)